MKVIIIGAGEVGYHIADSLSREGIDTVVIDRNEERLHEISEMLDVQTILGSGSSPEVLKRAGMAQAEMVIAVTDSDETNMIACLLASTQCRIPIRIARIRNVELNGDCSLFGTDRLNIDLCINPEQEAVRNVMNLLEFPGAAEVFSFAEGRIRLLGFQIDPDAAVIGKKLTALRAMEPGFKVLITAIVRGDQLIVPSGGSVIEDGDYLFAVTDATHVRELLRFFGKNTEPPRRIIIIGGGNTGMMLAMAIEKRNIAVKLIEKRHGRCELLASRLEKTIVLHGDGTRNSSARRTSRRPISSSP
jgi:trk system potassium uptake protein TrkA